MAQESQGGRPNEGRGGNRKRRYFRRKPGERATPGDAPGAAPEKPARAACPAPVARDTQAGRDKAGDRSVRSGSRRRRKSKGRRGGEVGRDQAPVTQAHEIDYVPPTSVYIYTHIVRPASGSAYEFRAEHFSKVGRAIEDYGIDVSPLFDEAARAAARPNMAEIFADFDTGEDDPPPLPPAEHMDANLLAVGRDTGMPTYAEDPYGAEDTAPPDADEPDGSPDVSIE